MKKLIAMASILAARMAGTLILFVLLARSVSVEDFGLFSTLYGAGSILAIVIDFGFAQSLLRDIGRNPEQALQIVSRGLYFKIAISAPILLITIVGAFSVTGSSPTAWLLITVVAFFVANSFTEFYGAAVRATNGYAAENTLQIAYSSFLIACMAILTPDIHQTAALILALKLIQLITMQQVSKRRIGEPSPRSESRTWRATFRNGAPYALDVGVGNLATSVDVLIVAHILGVPAAGLYQAGQKIAQGISTTAQIFGNVYLAKLSSADRQDSAYRKASRQLKFLVGACAAVMSSALLFGSDFIVDHVYGPHFADLKSLMPAFAVLILIRYLNTIPGIHLTSLGRQRIRVISNTAALAVFATSALPLLKTFGLSGVVYAQIASALTQSILYVFAMRRAVPVASRT